MANCQNTCDNCFEDKLCVRLHCNNLCIECFQGHFNHNNLNLRCVSCWEALDPQTFFQTTALKLFLQQIHIYRELAKYIDYQVCTCGVGSINKTLDSKYQCDHCHRWFCFFCNKNWNDSLMQNDKYTCHNNCDYEIRISYELVPSIYNKNMLIPNRRCCPKCVSCMAYDRSIYTKCDRCGYEYCFVCLQSTSDCYKSGGTWLNCTPIKKQDYSMFSR
jgi:hypothetical protein